MNKWRARAHGSGEGSRKPVQHHSQIIARAIALVGFSLLLPVMGPRAQTAPPASTSPAKPVAPPAAKAAQPGAKPPEKPPEKPAASPAVTATTPAAAVVPDADKSLLLIRTTLLTLNDALRTGNFTVLRDVSAPGFRDANSAAKLTMVFADLLRRGVDLTRVAILVPQLTAQPSIDPQSGMLRLSGTFPGQPAGIAFDMLFQPVAGRWQLFGLSVNPVQMVPQAAQTPAPPSPTKPAAPGQ